MDIIQNYGKAARRAYYFSGILCNAFRVITYRVRGNDCFVVLTF